MEEIIALLQSIRPMSAALEAHLRQILKPYSCRKRDKLLKAGEVAGHILFLRKGLVRSYSLVNGKPVSNWFMKDGAIVIAVKSFLRQVPADEFLEALEACEFFGITRAELWDTYERFPEFLWHGLLITGEYYMQSVDREKMQRRLTPFEKYAFLMETEPDLMSRVSNVHMASFLDLSPRRYVDVRNWYVKNGRRRGKKR